MKGVSTAGWLLALALEDCIFHELPHRGYLLIYRWIGTNIQYKATKNHNRSLPKSRRYTQSRTNRKYQLNRSYHYQSRRQPEDATSSIHGPWNREDEDVLAVLLCMSLQFANRSREYVTRRGGGEVWGEYVRRRDGAVAVDVVSMQQF
jgi:hypothetical protein